MNTIHPMALHGSHGGQGVGLGHGGGLSSFLKQFLNIKFLNLKNK